LNKEEHFKYWMDVSAEDWATASEIAKKNERKHFALFLGHLSVEKLLKALYVKKHDETPPYKHDFVILATKCGIELDERQMINLRIISTFNLEARYPDFKQSFYKKCTPEFISAEMQRIEETLSWIKSIIEATPF